MKRCKGIGRAKAHPGCGEPSEKRRYGLCHYCFIDWVKNTDEGEEWVKSRLLPKAKAKVKERTREKLESMKSIRRLINEARVPFQKWIRYRDANRECISCGTTESSIWDAGHYLKGEIYTGLIFNEINVNAQCGKCNRFLGGNESGYRIGLVKRYGEAKVKALEMAADKLRTYRFTREELKEIKREYQKRLKEL